MLFTGEKFEFDEKPVCDYWYCIDSNNYIYFILIVILFVVLAFLLYFLYKDFKTKK